MLNGNNENSIFLHVRGSFIIFAKSKDDDHVAIIFLSG